MLGRGGFFAAPHPWAAPEMRNLNRVNVLILICKCNHGDVNSYDVFTSTFIEQIVALKMDWFRKAFAWTNIST